MAASTSSANDPVFDAAVRFVLRLEGGAVNHPDDPGGMTKFGISQRWNRGVDVAALTVDQARDIYFERYWRANGYHAIPLPEIAAQALSAAVNLGPDEAGRMLQGAINSVRHEGEIELKVDGLVGPRTVTAMGGYWGPRRVLLYAAFTQALGERYLTRTWDGFTAGLVRRALAVPVECLGLMGAKV